MVFSTLGAYHFLLPASLDGIRPEILSIFLGYNNWWQIGQDADYFTRLANASPFTHLWFLGIEIQYIVIWPFLFFIYRKLSTFLSRKVALVFLLFIGLAASIVMPYLYDMDHDAITRLYYGTDTRIYALLLGAFLGARRAGIAYKQIVSKASNYISSVVFLLLIGLSIWGFISLGGQEPFVYQGGMFLYTILFLFLVWITEHPAYSVAALLDSAPIKWIGKRCYEIFLWQYPVLFLGQQLHGEALFGSGLWYNVCVAIVILLLSIWTHTLTDKIVHIHHCTWQDCIEKIRSFIFVGATGLGILCIGLGFVAMLYASNTKAAAGAELKAQLEQNAQIQEEENKKAAFEMAKNGSAVKNSLFGVAAIGDSVMLGASPALRKDLPNIYIDAKVSRYVGDGLAIAEDMDRKGRLGNVVLIGLGTNGPLTGYYEPQTKALLDFLTKNPNRQVFWVNDYAPSVSWEKGNNQYLEQLAKQYKNLTIINWYTPVSQHPEWLSKDGIHPNDLGIKEYATIVKEAMQNKLAQLEADKMLKNGK